jgi:hypothetical protein
LVVWREQNNENETFQQKSTTEKKLTTIGQRLEDFKCSTTIGDILAILTQLNQRRYQIVPTA